MANALLPKKFTLFQLSILSILFIAIAFTMGRRSPSVERWISGAINGPAMLQGSIARENRLDHHRGAHIERGDVLVYGDSLIELSYLSEWTDAPLLNRGISGDRIAMVASRIDPDAANLTIVSVGVNDLISRRDDKQIADDLSDLGARLCATGSSVKWLSVIPVNPAKFRREILTRSLYVEMPTPEAVAGLNAAIMAVAGECPSIEFVDISGGFVDASGHLKGELTIDGLHLNHRGAQMLTVAITALAI